MKAVEIKFSRLGVHSSSDPKGHVIYMLAALVTDDMDKRHRYYLEIPFVSSKKVPMDLVDCGTGFIVGVNGMYYAFNEKGEKLSSFPMEGGKVIQMDPEYIVTRKGDEVTFYTHTYELKGRRMLTPDEITMLDSKNQEEKSEN